MNAPDRYPTALAREVLAGGDESNDRFLDFFEARNIAQTLARAVDSLTAELDAYREENTRHREKIARVEALAEKHETTARNMGSGSYGGALAAKIAQEIRAALNGENA